MQVVMCIAPTAQECECYECDKWWEEPGDVDNEGDGYFFVPVVSTTTCPDCRIGADS